MKINLLTLKNHLQTDVVGITKKAPGITINFKLKLCHFMTELFDCSTKPPAKLMDTYHNAITADKYINNKG